MFSIRDLPMTIRKQNSKPEICGRHSIDWGKSGITHPSPMTP